MFSFTNWAIAGSQLSIVTMAAKAKPDIITWKNPGVASSPFVRIFMQITIDPMRSAKLLFDLKIAWGDIPSGSTCLRLLVKLFYQKLC